MSVLAGQGALVTGGSRGIGRAIVKTLAGLGCNVAFNYRSRKQDADALCAEVADTYKVQCVVTCVDIKDFSGVKSWIEETRERFGRLDILVNNAGIIIDKALMMMTPEDWQEVIDTNLNGMFHATRSCIVTFMKQKSGTIINISSVSGLIGLPRQTNYAAAKGGMNAFTKSLAKEVAPYNIRVNAIAPGYIETDMLSELTDEQRTAIVKTVPVGRIGTCDDVTSCVRFLLSEDAQYVTGQIIRVDGGLTMQ